MPEENDRKRSIDEVANPTPTMAYELGVIDGYEIIFLDMMKLAGEKFTLGYDEEAKMLREYANKLDSRARRERREFNDRSSNSSNKDPLSSSCSEFQRK